MSYNTTATNELLLEANLSLKELLQYILVELRSIRLATSALASDGNRAKVDDFNVSLTLSQALDSELR